MSALGRPEREFFAGERAGRPVSTGNRIRRDPVARSEKVSP